MSDPIPDNPNGVTRSRVYYVYGIGHDGFSIELGHSYTFRGAEHIASLRQKKYKTLRIDVKKITTVLQWDPREEQP